MFGKKQPKLETIVGHESVVTGELSVKGTIRIDGSVEGDVSADWVVVGETGRIKGNVRSRGMVVGGLVEGTIDADELVDLKSKASVTGEIRTSKLAMSEGAVFDGTSSMKTGTGTGAGAEGGTVARLPSRVPQTS